MFEHRVRRHDGAWRTFAIRAVPLLDADSGEVVEWVGVHSDITEQRLAEARLRESNLELEQVADEFRTLADSMPQLCWMAQPDGHIYWYNSRWYEYTGTGAADMEGWGWQSVHDPAVLPLVVERWRASISRGVAFEMTFPLLGADGVFRPFLTRVAPLLDAEGAVRRWIGINVDVTEAQQLNAELESRVEARTAELQTMAVQLAAEAKESELARSRAEAATAAKAAFLANMSHEIRTPMNGVMGFSELLLASDLDADQQRHVKLIHESAQALLKLLNDILDVSKMDAGLMEVAAEPFILGHGVKQCIRLMSPMAEQKGVSIQADISPDFPRTVLTDGLRVRQILLNLLGNAVKFTSVGSIQVDVRRGIYDGANPVFSVSVADTGVGIDQDRIDSVFEPFVQADGSISRRFGGSGLGLSISRRLANLMGGAVALHRRPGGGTVATLTLPLTELAEAPVAAASSVPRTPDAGSHLPRVLIAEDHDINQQLIMAMAHRAGMNPSLASDGGEAIAMVAEAERSERPFELVLMDIQMPGVDGFEATRRLRALGYSPEKLPIVAVTANAYAEDVQSCLDAGMQAHLAKPVGIGDLTAILGRFVRTASHAVSQPKPVNAKLLERYRERKVETLRKLDELAALDDPDQAAVADAASLLHKLAGVAAMFDETALGDCARRLEDELVSSPVDERRSCVRAAAFALRQAA